MFIYNAQCFDYPKHVNMRHAIGYRLLRIWPYAWLKIIWLACILWWWRNVHHVHCTQTIS